MKGSLMNGKAVFYSGSAVSQLEAALSLEILPLSATSLVEFHVGHWRQRFVPDV